MSSPRYPDHLAAVDRVPFSLCTSAEALEMQYALSGSGGSLGHTTEPLVLFP